MANNYFNFKQFTIQQDKCAFKVGTDGVLLGACSDVESVYNILDIGTGTGLIAIMLAQRCRADITAIEPDNDSFEQASVNVRSCRWADRIKVVNTDLQHFDPKGEQFSLIVSNPPFFKASLKNPDPKKAAARHNDNLSSSDLLEGVSKLLAETGKFQVILPYVEGNIFIAAAHGFGLYCNSILKIKPLLSTEIRRLLLTFSRRRQKTTEKFLVIEHGKRHDFTEEYINLTRDFYLKF